MTIAEPTFPTKKCTWCGSSKPIAFFHFSEKKKAFHSQCRPCQNYVRLARRNGTMPHSIRAKAGIGILRRCGQCELWKEEKEFYKHKDYKRQGVCQRCFKASRKTFYEENNKEIRAKESLARWILRLEIIAGYGGVCECCGESSPEFLTIDHVGGGGRADRNLSGGPKSVYKRLKKLGFPKNGFRLLCYNCNCSIGAKGYCPHQLKKGAA